jgi:arsenite/tail-anchored protein-transporting ATPase
VPPKRLDPREFFATTRLAIVAGKGGVGKTTVTAVLARAARRCGLRVLVVELDGKPALATLVGEVPVLAITGAAGLAEYLETHGLRRVAKRLSNSGVIEVVATAAPGIDDIIVLGKLKQLERSGEYDLIVVDGPAAGHAITFLMSARSLLDTVRGGPIQTQATDVLELLSDAARCQVVLVTLPETTPVNELVETAYALEERVGVQLGPVVVNGVDAGPAIDVPVGAPTVLVDAANYRNARRDLHRRALQRLGTDLALAQLHLPHVATAGLGPDDIDALADALLAETHA